LQNLAVIEVKTPKAFPYGGNLAERFKDEQLRLKPNPAATLKSLRNSPRREQALDEKVLINQNKETKVSRAICQLWGYMTVNHLKYGILTTFNETFFLKREFCEEQGVKLEISPGIRIGDPQTPIVGALCYFTSLLLESHLYTLPCSSLSKSTYKCEDKDAVQLNKYEVANVNLSDFHFTVPTDFKAHHVVVGQHLQGKPSLLKLLDTTQHNSSSMFLAELQAYERLDELQGAVIPTLEQSYLISNSLFAFALEDCGNPITQSQLRKMHDQVAQALKSIHAKGVVHGDIALRNILINSLENRVVLIDFGLAKFFVSNGQEKEGLECITSDKMWTKLCDDELLQLDQLL
jgi:serine/threonine protein kinase